MTSINWSNVTDFGQIPALANTSSNGYFWMGVFYMIWIVLMILLGAYGMEIAILVGSFLTMIIGILLVYGGLLGWTHVVVVVSVELFMFLYVIWNSKKT